MALETAIHDLHKLHSAGQEKYTYFVLAATGAAMGFAIQKTEGLPLSLWLIPTAIAVLCWALSFYLGCRNVDRSQAAVMANYALLQLIQGTHPEQPQHPTETEAAKSGVRKAMRTNIEQASTAYRWHFRMLLAGALCFLLWRVLEMYRLT